jgi:hypothetical protein
MGFKGDGYGPLEALPRTCLEGLKVNHENSVNIAGVLTEIRTRHLMNTSSKSYPYAKPLGIAGILATVCRSDDPILVNLTSRACKTILFIVSDCIYNYTESLNDCLYKYFGAVLAEIVLLHFIYKIAMLLPVQIRLACAAANE